MDVIIAFSCCPSILYRFQVITVFPPLFPPSRWFSVILHLTTSYFFFFSCLSTFLSLFLNSLFWGLLTYRSKSLCPFCNSLLPDYLLLTTFSYSTLLMWPPPPPLPPPRETISSLLSIIVSLILFLVLWSSSSQDAIVAVTTGCMFPKNKTALNNCYVLTMLNKSTMTTDRGLIAWILLVIQLASSSTGVRSPSYRGSK